MTHSRKLWIVSLALAWTLGWFNPALSKEGVGSEEAELARRVEALEKRLDRLENAFAQKENKAELEARARSELSAIQALIADDKFEEAKADLVKFLRTYNDPRMTSTARTMAKELSVIGTNVPARWGIEKWFQGGEAALQSRQEPTVLFFWETWCVYCRQQMPTIQALYKDLKAEGLEIVGLTTVSGSATERGVKDFIKRFELSFPVAKEDGSVGRAFEISGIPMATVIKEGKVIWRGHPGRLSQEKLRAWL